MNISIKEKAEGQRRGDLTLVLASIPFPFKFSLCLFLIICFLLTPRNPVKFVLLAPLRVCKGKLIGVTLLVSGKAFHLSFTVLPEATTSRKPCYSRPHPCAFHGTGKLFTKMAV